MRDISQDDTIKRNYLQKYRFLIQGYKLVKAGKHPRFEHRFKTVRDLIKPEYHITIPLNG